MQYEPAHWPGQIVTVCPLCSADTQDEFEYLAIVEIDAVSQPVPGTNVLKGTEWSYAPLAFQPQTVGLVLPWVIYAVVHQLCAQKLRFEASHRVKVSRDDDVNSWRNSELRG